MEDSKKLKKMFKIFRKRISFVISFVFLAVITAAIISSYAIVPVYEVSTQILVNQERTIPGDREERDIQLDLGLIDTYRDIIKSTVILEKVIDKENLNMTPEALFDKVTIRTNDNSQVVNIFIVDENQSRAVEIANTITETFQEEIQTLMNTNNVNILSPAVVRSDLEPINVNPILNIALAGFVSFIFGTIIAFLMEFLDQSLKSEEDVELALGVPVLGVISPFVMEKEAGQVVHPALKRREAQ
ncbi:Wzz/FepE/Etk N-terminal domain-containing protein [Planomicrobium sp. YIM 101495]|uniref:YveK family protein n=1 Tax=Planomicrobium sp. YIM 101495 TaxID=2665160 RepID=UPI0018AB124D